MHRAGGHILHLHEAGHVIIRALQHPLGAAVKVRFRNRVGALAGHKLTIAAQAQGISLQITGHNQSGSKSLGRLVIVTHFHNQLAVRYIL